MTRRSTKVWLHEEKEMWICINIVDLSTITLKSILIYMQDAASLYFDSTKKQFNNLDHLISAVVELKYPNQFCPPLHRYAYVRYIVDMRNQLSRDSTVFLFRRVQNFTLVYHGRRRVKCDWLISQQDVFWQRQRTFAFANLVWKRS